MPDQSPDFRPTGGVDLEGTGSGPEPQVSVSARVADGPGADCSGRYADRRGSALGRREGCSRASQPKSTPDLGSGAAGWNCDWVFREAVVAIASGATQNHGCFAV